MAYLHRPDCHQLYVTSPPMHPWEPGGATDPFIFGSSWGLEANTTLRNGCRRHRHCEFLCDLVLWHTQGSRFCESVCELLAYGHFSRPVTLMTPYADRGMVWCSLRSVFTWLLTCATSLPFPSGCVSSRVIFTLNHCSDVFSHTTYPGDPEGCESFGGSPCTCLHVPAGPLQSHGWSP